MGHEVKPRRRTRLSRKHQVTIPVALAREAGLQPGDELTVALDDRGRVVLEPADDVEDRFAGMWTGTYFPGYLEALRDEWDRAQPIADLDELERRGQEAGWQSSTPES